jgi:hypothetical protein
LIYGFRPSVVKKHPLFYIALLAFMAFNCAMDAFMPYWLIYFQNATAQGGLGLTTEGGSFYIAVGVILVVASSLVIFAGLTMEKHGKILYLFPALALSAIGFLGMYFSKSLVWVIICGTAMMSGYLIGTAALGAIIRDETPSDEVGLFQGVRMIFAVMLPMIIGSNVSQAFFNLSGATYTNDYGESVVAPTSLMFLVALGFVALAFIPAIWLYKDEKKKPAAPASDNAVGSGK